MGDMPQNMQVTLPDSALPTERMAPGGTATIMLGNTPSADAFLREAMPQNVKMTLAEQPLATQRTAPGGTSTITLGVDDKPSKALNAQEDSENDPNMINRCTVPSDTKIEKVLGTNT